MKGKSKLLILIIIVFGILIIKDFYGNNETLKLETNTSSIIASTYIATPTINAIEELRKEYNNNEIVGIIKVPDTDMYAIVAQTTNNTKYLTKDLTEKKNILGNPFLDYRVDIDKDKKLLIYGHNANKYNPPFKFLENYYDEDYYLSHPYIELITLNNKYRYKIFSVYVETGDWDYMNIEFKNNHDWLKHLEKLKSNSIYDTDTEISEDDSILILQTCSYKSEYAKYNKKYLLVMARRIEE